MKSFSLKFFSSEQLLIQLQSVPNTESLKKLNKKEFLQLCKKVFVDTTTTSKVSTAMLVNILANSFDSGLDGFKDRSNERLSKVLINAWNLKPFKSTEAISIGLENEKYICQHLPHCWQQNGAGRIEEVTTTGVRTLHKDPISSEGFLHPQSTHFVVNCRGGDCSLAAVEMKTPSDLDWISNSQTLVSVLERIIRCTLRIDTVEELSKNGTNVTHPGTYGAVVHFCKAVNCSEHRCQILHHGCVLQLSRVLDVVETRNEILYVEDIFIPNSVVQTYKAVI